MILCTLSTWNADHEGLRLNRTNGKHSPVRLRTSSRTMGGDGLKLTLTNHNPNPDPKSHQREGQPRKTENELTNDGWRWFKTNPN